MLNQMVIAAMPFIPKPIIKQVAKRYIAGDRLSDAVKVTKDFEAKGGTTTIDVLGEFVTTKERAMHERESSAKVIDAISENKLKTYLSIKPTSLGLGIDPNFGFENIKYIIAKAAKDNIFVRIDMENSPYTDMTFDLYKKLRAEGLENIGLVIQAYMRRSEADIKALKEYKPWIRLCKGIYKEAPSIAFQGKDEVRDNYKKLFNLIVESDMKIGIATHDDILIDYARDYIAKNKLAKNKYEFQMLLGVRENKRDETLALGHDLRIYTPFGEDWYGYSTRRLQENPDMAGHIFKAFFGIGN
jgi:proline dehydrogenase